MVVDAPGACDGPLSVRTAEYAPSQLVGTSNVSNHTCVINFCPADGTKIIAVRLVNTFGAPDSRYANLEPE